MSDHFQPWRHTGGHAPFSLAWMAAVGERTSTIQIGTSVMTPTFRYNPAVLAQAFATLGVLYPGRIMLGCGYGGGSQRGCHRIPRCGRAGLAGIQGAVRAPP